MPNCISIHEGLEWVRKPIFAKCHSERSEESYTLKVYEIPEVRFFAYAQNDSNKVYEIPEVRFFAYAQNDSNNAASEFPNLLDLKCGGEYGEIYVCSSDGRYL